jgi:hypothetical protein
MSGKRQSSAAAMAELRNGIEGRLEQIRARIAELQARLELVNEGAVPTGEYIARVNEWVDGKAAEFAQSVGYSLSALRLPEGRGVDVGIGRLGVRGGGAGEDIAVADAAPLLCFLFGDVLKERLGDVIAKSPYQEGPPLAQRAELRRELQAELDRLEIDEETLIVEGEQVGLALPRRVDCRPEIILALASEAEAA